VKAVFFDVGETLMNESRLWSLWADWLGIAHHRTRPEASLAHLKIENLAELPDQLEVLKQR
jgi:hypothetical protein